MKGKFRKVMTTGGHYAYARDRGAYVEGAIYSHENVLILWVWDLSGNSRAQDTDPKYNLNWSMTWK